MVWLGLYYLNVDWDPSIHLLAMLAVLIHQSYLEAARAPTNLNSGTQDIN